MTVASARLAGLRKVLLAAAAVCAALLVVAALCEGGLRLAGWLALTARDRPATAPGKQTILCLGDSWTYGTKSGDPARLSYPAQLERRLNQQLGDRSVRVINRGQPGMDTTKILGQLQRQLRQLRPTVVVLLAGGANWFDMDQMSGIMGRQRSAARWGPLRRWRLFRVAQLLRGQLGQADPRRPPNVSRGVLTAVAQMMGEATAADDRRGLPELSAEGCPAQEPARYLVHQVHAAGCRQPAQVERLVRRQPGCAAVLTAAAEACLRRGKHLAARGWARRALQVRSADPRAMAALTWATAGLKQQLPRARYLELRGVAHRNARSVLVQRAVVLGGIQNRAHPCSTLSNLRRLERACPRCEWASSAHAHLRHHLNLPAVAVLRSDFAQISALCQRHGARLLLLNYPPNELCACRGDITGVIARFAAERSASYLDLAPALGAYKGRQQRGLIYDGGAEGGGHPNAHGYRLLADAVARRLVQLGWLAGQTEAD